VDRKLNLRIDVSTAGGAALKDSLRSIGEEARRQQAALANAAGVGRIPAGPTHVRFPPGTIPSSPTHFPASRLPPVLPAGGPGSGLGGGFGGLDPAKLLGSVAPGLGNVAGIAAAAGPLAAIPLGVKAVGDTVRTLAGMPFKTVAGGLGAISGAVRELQGNLGPIGLAVGGIEKFGGAVKKYGDLWGPLGVVFQGGGEGITGVAQSVRGILGDMVHLAGVASPGEFRIWTTALADVQGVIGQRMVPVLRLATEGVRFFGDVLQTILPSQAAVAVALGPLREAWGGLKIQITELVRALAPLAQAGLTSAIRALAGVAVVATSAIGSLTDSLKTIPGVQEWLAQQKQIDLRSSRGAAGRIPEFTTLQGLQQKIITNAYTMGKGPGEDAVSSNTKQTVKELAEANRRLDELIRINNRLQSTRPDLALRNPVTAAGEIGAAIHDFVGEAIKGWR
jgi:hypothetical protein